jgi:hypothetical protein
LTIFDQFITPLFEQILAPIFGHILSIIFERFLTLIFDNFDIGFGNKLVMVLIVRDPIYFLDIHFSFLLFGPLT